MSLCHAIALQEIAGESIITDSIVAIDTMGLSNETLKHLKHCKEEYHFNWVEMLLHMNRTLIVNAHAENVLPIAPPILTRVFQTLSRGFVHLLNAKKIAG